LSRAAMEAMARELATVALNRYPDATAGELRRALAARAGCAVEELMLGNGSDELIALLCATFAEPRAGQTRGKIAYAVPGFVVFRTAALAHGLEPIEVPFGPRMEADEAALFAAIAEHKPNLVFLATPNNPTGTQWSRATVVKLVEQHRDVITVVDEAYLSYCDARSCVDLALANANCVVLQTLSKIGLAALRVGLLIGRREVLAAVEKVRPPYNLSTLAQRAALKLVVDFKAELESHFEEVKHQRRALYDALGQLDQTAGLEVFPSGGNFLLVRAKDARALYDALVERGVLVRLFDSGLLAGCMRITIGTPDENSWLLDAIKAALA
ncbi:MAG TPA: aminotransferase class I/II-fold pyridoxal phosphate-dependent enzyme, partial [Polyangia bacterium]